jgi:hypothetical protein
MREKISDKQHGKNKVGKYPDFIFVRETREGTRIEN